MLFLEILFGLAAFGLALLVLVAAGLLLATILLDDEPEAVLHHPTPSRLLLGR